MQKEYNITFSINREYLLFMCVTLYSLLKNNQKYYFNVYILHNNCLNEQEIEDICNKYPLNQYNNFKIHLVDVSTIDGINDFKILGHWSKEIYFKLFLPQLLPNVDTTLHLDTDVIIRGDISDFLETDIKDYLFYADNYNYSQNAEVNICVGVMLMNLKLAREINVINDFYKEFNLNNNLTEEIFINKLYKNKIKLSPKNYIVNTYVNDINEINIDIAKILHLIAPKPWLLQRFKREELKTKGIEEYYSYLKNFTDSKYALRFKLLQFYVFNFAIIFNSIERRIKNFIKNRICKKDNRIIKSNFLTEKIYKYSFIKKK